MLRISSLVHTARDSLLTVSDVVCCVRFELSVKLLGHFLSGYADEVGVELEAQIGLERDVDLLLRLGIHDALVVVEAETLGEDARDFGVLLLGTTIF